MDTPVVYKEEADRVPPGYRERQSRKPAPPQQHLCPAASAGYQSRQPARTEGQGHSCPATGTTWAPYVAGREAWWTPEGSVSLEPPGEFWFRLIQSLLHGRQKILWALVLFNSEFAAWALEGSVNLEPSGEVLVLFNSEFAEWALEGSVSCDSV